MTRLYFNIANLFNLLLPGEVCNSASATHRSTFLAHHSVFLWFHTN